MLNLSLKELRFIAKNRNINGINKLLGIINKKKKEEGKESLFKSKNKKPKKFFISQQEIVFFN